MTAPDLPAPFPPAALALSAARASPLLDARLLLVPLTSNRTLLPYRSPFLGVGCTALLALIRSSDPVASERSSLLSSLACLFSALRALFSASGRDA